MSPSRCHALFTEASMLSHKPQSISSQFENRFHSSDPTQRSPQSKQGVKNLRSSKLLPFWSPFILHLLRKPIRRRNVSRMHSLAQSCCWGISVSFFTSLQELHNQASWEKGKWVEKCLCSTCREELPDVTCQHQRHSVTRWGCVAGGGGLTDWQALSVNENITQGEKEKNNHLFNGDLCLYLQMLLGKVMFTWQELHSGLCACFGDNIRLVVIVGVWRRKNETHTSIDIHP